MQKSKAQRKSFRPFSPAFFSHGTVVELKASGPSVVMTVDKLVKTTPDHYIITSQEIDLNTGEHMIYSIGHVTKIIERAPGVAVIDPQEKIDYLNDIAARQLETGLICETLKHRSHYLTRSIGELIIAVSDRYFGDDELVDDEKLVRMVMATNIVKFHITGDWYAPIDYYTVSKKKLHAVVKRLIPKCRMKAIKAQKEYDEQIDTAMSGWSDGYKFNHTNDLFSQPTDHYPDKVFNDPTWLASMHVSPSNVVILDDADKAPAKPLTLGDLLKQKFDRMEAEGKITVTTPDENTVIDAQGNRADMIFDPVSTIGKIDMTPEMVQAVTELNDDVFGKGNWEGGLSLTPHQPDVEQMLDNDELLSNSITYVDDGETDEGNLSPPKDKED